MSCRYFSVGYKKSDGTRFSLLAREERLRNLIVGGPHVTEPIRPSDAIPSDTVRDDRPSEEVDDSRRQVLQLGAFAALALSGCGTSPSSANSGSTGSQTGSTGGQTGSTGGQTGSTGGQTGSTGGQTGS